MDVFTSYFYQIRFFKPHMIPFSTAVWDPKWFHKFQDQDHFFLDKRGVVNGFRAPILAPGKETEGTCAGANGSARGCNHSPADCLFLRLYREQLSKIDCDKFIGSILGLCEEYAKLQGLTEKPVPVFIVHEAPNNPCSERVVLQEWFTANGFPCRELDYPIK